MSFQPKERRGYHSKALECAEHTRPRSMSIRTLKGKWEYVTKEKTVTDDLLLAAVTRTASEKGGTINDFSFKVVFKTH